MDEGLVGQSQDLAGGEVRDGERGAGDVQPETTGAGDGHRSGTAEVRGRRLAHRIAAAALGPEPHLDEAGGRVAGDLAVRRTAAGPRHRELARPEGRRAGLVGVDELPEDHPGDQHDVTVLVRLVTAAATQEMIVQPDQRPEAQPIRVVGGAEGERVASLAA
jgi:hypothetical protein